MDIPYLFLKVNILVDLFHKVNYTFTEIHIRGGEHHSYDRKINPGMLAMGKGSRAFPSSNHFNRQKSRLILTSLTNWTLMRYTPTRKGGATCHSGTRINGF